MDLKGIYALLGMSALLYGCTATQGIKQSSYQYDSPQEVIEAKRLNSDSAQAKEYIYHWGKNSEQVVESMLPRQHMAGYCRATGGRLTLLYKTQMHLIKDNKTKNLLLKQPNVMQGVGAYRCVKAGKNQWIVSIEPTDERTLDRQGKRAVSLFTQMMTEAEARQVYQSTSNKRTNTVTKPTSTKAAATTPAPVATPTKEASEVKKPASRVVVTPQQQQAKLYVSARRDINSGKNLINACNAAQHAYNYGKLQGTDGTRVYTESGMLVARCLTQIPTYSRRFPNAQAQARRVLQNLAKNYNHAAAKNMLNNLPK